MDTVVNRLCDDADLARRVATLVVRAIKFAIRSLLGLREQSALQVLLGSGEADEGSEVGEGIHLVLVRWGGEMK